MTTRPRKNRYVLPRPELWNIYRINGQLIMTLDTLPGMPLVGRATYEQAREITKEEETK